MISPWIGFSLAVSGMYRPPLISSVSSSGRIATRSASGKTLSRVFVAGAMVVPVCVLRMSLLLARCGGLQLTKMVHRMLSYVEQCTDSVLHLSSTLDGLRLILVRS